MSVDQNKIDFKAIRDAASKTAAKKSIDGTALPDKINFKAIREETLKKKRTNPISYYATCFARWCRRPYISISFRRP